MIISGTSSTRPMRRRTEISASSFPMTKKTKAMKTLITATPMRSSRRGRFCRRGLNVRFGSGGGGLQGQTVPPQRPLRHRARRGRPRSERRPPPKERPGKRGRRRNRPRRPKRRPRRRRQAEQSRRQRSGGGEGGRRRRRGRAKEKARGRERAAPKARLPRRRRDPSPSRGRRSRSLETSTTRTFTATSRRTTASTPRPALVSVLPADSATTASPTRREGVRKGRQRSLRRPPRRRRLTCCPAS